MQTRYVNLSVMLPINFKNAQINIVKAIVFIFFGIKRLQWKTVLRYLVLQSQTLN